MPVMSSKKPRTRRGGNSLSVVYGYGEIVGLRNEFGIYWLSPTGETTTSRNQALEWAAAIHDREVVRKVRFNKASKQ